MHNKVKRYRLVGLYENDPELKNVPCSVYVLVSSSTPAEKDVVRFVEADIDEAIEAFQQERIYLNEMPPKFTMKRIACDTAGHSEKRRKKIGSLRKN